MWALIVKTELLRHISRFHPAARRLLRRILRCNYTREVDSSTVIRVSKNHRTLAALRVQSANFADRMSRYIRWLFCDRLLGSGSSDRWIGGLRVAGRRTGPEPRGAAPRVPVLSMYIAKARMSSP